ncbi:hypothetical protein CY35_04G072900 [Sphagnum magellanicum]|nr:hypothetical protein CY35_04G072900 [Sphagnum magellanicum]KAH9565341.1 hypothetical protein CY35_04G072900 [Sphagnum magellanicum]
MPDCLHSCSEFPCPICHLAEPVKLIWRGYTYRKDQEVYVAEIRPPKWRGKLKIGLGSYRTQIAAAMALDVGIHYTNKNTDFNILSRAPRVPPLPSGLSFEDGNDIEAIRKFVRKQTKEFVEKNERLVPRLPSGLSFQNSNDAEKFKEFVRLEARKFVDVYEYHVETARPPTSGPVEAADLGFQGTEAFRAAGPSSSSSSSEELALSPYMARVAKDKLLDNQADRMFWELLLMPNQGSQDVKLALPAALLPEKLPPSSNDQLVNSFPDPSTFSLWDVLPNEGFV